MITNQPITRQRGTGMIEVMVAAIIIGIGLLGIAALQGSSMQASTGAALRARAVDLTAAMISRMQANQIADNCYCRNTAACIPAAPDACVRDKTKLNLMNPDTDDDYVFMQDYTSTQAGVAMGMATADLAAMDLAVASDLPGGAMLITCTDRTPIDTDPCSPGSTMLVTISWSTQRDNTTDNVFTDSISTPVVSARPLVPGQ